MKKIVQNDKDDYWDCSDERKNSRGELLTSAN